ncbi:MAG: class II glutamine amidotransferase [Planctomycetes bacterium]|nr:class II glutamine amidotransferase [Planctomycetota bacterium]
MSQLLGLSFDCTSSPSIELKGMRQAGDTRHRPYGWGFGWFPGEDRAAMLVKDPTSIGDNAMTKVLRDWKRFRSTVFVCHLRGAAQRITQQDTHPFLRSYGGRDWLLAHNGDLQAEAIPLESDPTFFPVGRTDSERAFCWLLERVRQRRGRQLSDVGWPELHGWLTELNALGTLNLLLSDGHDLVAYHDQRAFHGLTWQRRLPPYAPGPLESDDISLDFQDARDVARTSVIVSTRPLSGEQWTPFLPGQMLVARRGAVIWTSHPAQATTPPSAPGDAPGPAPTPTPLHVAAAGPAVMQTSALQGAQGAPPSPDAARAAVEPASPSRERRRYHVLHRTSYRYALEVEQSTHLYRLRPVHDLAQTVLDHTLELSVEGSRRDFEDVFGNQATRLTVERPYHELGIVARSIVEVTADLDVQQAPRRDNIPLVWMPWQRQMMSPYLLPPELPETQLRELNDYAMSFVERQDYDLFETLNDMNRTIYRDYAYVSGSTTLETTPFEVHTSRRGVCQDFANLFICLARLLGIPARYRVGYIFTGSNYENKIQSDASHAWAELYLPWLGWRGYDPTNGCLVGSDHVRVASGRNYRDATPSSGTIYAGGGGESLEIEVRVVPVGDDVRGLDQV